jgi:acetylornithine deacetylase/succinyl-diaminopimelate desuccinylase-like protein
LSQLVKVAADPGVKITIPEVRSPLARPSPLTPQIMKPIEKIADEMFPGAPVIPILQPGATDAQFMNPVGIPTYGITGLFKDPDGGNVHGLNERIRVRSLYEGRTFLYRLVNFTRTSSVVCAEAVRDSRRIRASSVMMAYDVEEANL